MYQSLGSVTRKCPETTVKPEVYLAQGLTENNTGCYGFDNELIFAHGNCIGEPMR